MVDDEDRAHLRRCVELARDAVDVGEQPFGSVLVDADGQVRFEDHSNHELVGLAQTLSLRRRRPLVSGKSSYSDWFFSGLLALTALSGFATEILRYAGVRIAYPAYAVHLIFVFGLFAYFPFSKFSHAMYRPAALAFARQIGRRKPSMTVAGQPRDREVVSA